MHKIRYLHFSILIALGFLIYSNSLQSSFVYDDYWYILDNDYIKDLTNFLYPGGTRYVGFLSFALNYSIGYYNILGYKLVNISIHIINAMLLYGLISLILKSIYSMKDNDKVSSSGARYIPFIISLFFLSHPIATQPVNYISQRFASLATLFFLLSVVCYIKSRLLARGNGGGPGGPGGPGARGPNLWRFVLYAASIISAVLAQKTKEISFTLPFIICFLEFALFSYNSKGEREGIRRRILLLVPFIITLVIIPTAILIPGLGVSPHITGAAADLNKLQVRDLKGLSSYNYLITQFRVILTYLRLMIFPLGQRFLYDYPTYRSFLIPQVFISFIFLASIFCSGLYLFVRSMKRKETPGLLVSIGIIWFFLTLSVESSVVPIQHVIFEHRAYLPSIGFFISISGLILYLPLDSTKAKRTLWIVALSIVLILSALSYKRNMVWKSDFLLWSDTIKKSPNDSTAHFNMAWTFDKKGDTQNAIAHYRESIRLFPISPDTHYNLAMTYMKVARYEEALHEFSVVDKLSGNYKKTNIYLKRMKNRVAK